MKLWIDDVRSAPEGYNSCKSVRTAIEIIKLTEYVCNYFGRESIIELIDIGYDAGYYSNDNDEGTCIDLLYWLEETGYNYPIRIHSMDSIEVANMRRIIQKNGWTEVK